MHATADLGRHRPIHSLIIYKSTSINFLKIVRKLSIMEPISSTASIASVACLSLQLYDGVTKLREFWQSIKEAPNDIDHMCAEVDLLIKWLTIIANDHQRHLSSGNLASDTAVIETLEFCLRIVVRIRDGSHEMKEDIARNRKCCSRRWASIKAVLRKDRTEAMLQDLEKLRSLMIPVQIRCTAAYTLWRMKY